MNIEKIIRIKSPDDAKIKKRKLEKIYGKENILAIYDTNKEEYEIKVLSKQQEWER